MKIIIGLGNPGRKYKNNRHNLGFRVIDKLSDYLEVPVDKKKFSSKYGKKGSELLLVKPVTFMNDSGSAVISWINYYKVEQKDLLVVCDDLTLDLGLLRFRRSGSHGGHNGIKSVISRLNSNQFPRLRMGIGLPRITGVVRGKSPEEDFGLPLDSADYVLQDFKKDEKDSVEKMINYVPMAVKEFIENGIDEAMNKYNNRSIVESTGKP